MFTGTTNNMLTGFRFRWADDVTGGGIVTELLNMWSLATEVQFYALWAVALWALTRAGVRLRWMAALTAVAVAALAVARYRAYAGGAIWLDLYFTTWSRLDAPLVGALAGIAFVAGWPGRVDRRLLVGLGTTGLAAFLATAFLTDWSLPALPRGLYTGLALSAALTILAVVTSGDSGLARVLSWRPLAWLGTISYSLYVWHYGIFFTIERRDPSWPGPVRLAVGVGVALAVATASYHLVERPLVRRRTRPVPLPAADVDGHGQLLPGAGAVDDAPDGGDVGVVAAPADGDVVVGFDQAVGGGEVDPASPGAGGVQVVGVRDIPAPRDVEAHPGV